MGGAKDVLDVMGRNYVLGGATLTAFTISKLAGAEKAALTSGTMLEAFSITMALTTALKFASQRTRPDGSNDRSFPSGHASGAFALATVTEIMHGPLYGVPAYLLATAISVSRLDENKHVASDVVAGAVLGTLIGLGTAKFHKKEFSKFFLVPTAGEGSAGLTLVHPF
jgi:membrane-associated phospholipid phosphatase